MKAVKKSSESRQYSEGNNAGRVGVKRKINPLSPPTTIELSGVRVHFPFKPYKCQETYMQAVMNALLKSENALLESPTGTGKTLCLLCATLAWQRQQARLLKDAAVALRSSTTSDVNVMMTSSSQSIHPDVAPQKAAFGVPTIIYASRTHSQLSQVVRELRNTRYRPRHAVLGSREQMCVNPKVKTATATASDINHDCNKLGKDRKCRFRNNLEGFDEHACHGGRGGATDKMHQPVMDMEDLVEMGKQNSICPFYYTRAQVERAELVLLPYNYLFDKDARATTLSDIPWNNAVVIFDEAHNLESFASESASFDLSNTDIAACIKEINTTYNILQIMPEQNFGIKVDNLIRLKQLFLNLENYILNLGPQTAYNGEFMIDVFSKGMGVTHANHEIFIDEVRKVGDLLMETRGKKDSKGSPKLEHFIQCLKRVYGHALESRCLAKAAFYRVHVSPKPPPNQTNTTGRTVSYWCFAPSLAMEELASLKVRSILVTSGTLAPLQSYSMELGLSFPHTLENPHIISTNQIHVRVIGKGVSGKLLNSSYERRQNKDYYIELGNTLVALAKVTPDGMLVFFPSYSVMETCVDEWGGPTSSRKTVEAKNNFFAARRKNDTTKRFSFPFTNPAFLANKGQPNPWIRLLSTKSIILEPRTSADLPEALAEFQKYLAMPKFPGCIFMGVCRGKISEGIDFANEQSRAVVITGLPFPPTHDPKVKMKREFLDSARASKNVKASSDGGFDQTSSSVTSRDKLSGHEWYQQQSHRAVNQAIGRVIRNQSDYGAVLLMDSRFEQPQNQIGLSKWLRPYIQKDEGIGVAVRTLAQFFKTADAEAVKRKEKMKRFEEASVIKYENDAILSEEEDAPTKIALVRPAQSGDATENITGSEDYAYVVPKNVVARLDVADIENKRSQTDKNNIPAPPMTGKPCIKTNDAVFASRKLSSSGTSTKNLAVQFMEKVKRNLKGDDQSKIKKTILDMKKYGEARNMDGYLECATIILELIIGCEKFELHDKEAGPHMLLLFFSLLPSHYRKEVEMKAFEMVFTNSGYGELCREKLPSCDVSLVRSLTSEVLHSLWCREKFAPLSDNEYLRLVKGLFAKLQSSEKAFASMVSAFMNLIPYQYRNATQAFCNNIMAAIEVKWLREADRSSTVEPVQPKEANISSFALSDIPMNSAPKRKFEPIFPPRIVANPYAQKKSATASSVELKINHPSKSLTVYLKSIESDPFVKKSSSEIVKRIPSNAPKDVSCPICSNPCVDLFIADCNHTACLSCWQGWLKRSETCMTCKADVTKEALARIVYETTHQSEASRPLSLSQLGSRNDNDADDELEII